MLDSAQKKTVDQMLAGLFGSAAFDELWGRYHRVERFENPGPDVLEKASLDSFPGTAEERAQLYWFLADFVGIYAKAIGTPKDGEKSETAIYRERLESLQAYFQHEVGDVAIKRGELPEEYRKILDIAEMETATDPIRPFGTLKDFTLAIIHHFDEFRQEKPILFYSMGLFSVTFVSMAYWKVGGSAAPYVDPEMLFDRNLDASAFLDLDSGYTPDVDYEALQASDLASIKLPCHDHFHQMFGDTWLDAQYQAAYDETIAQSAAKLFGDDSSFIVHCGKLKTIVADATNFANGFTSAWTERLSPIVEGPARILADYAFAEGPNREAFLDGVQFAAGGIYWFDNVENLVIHLSLLGMGYVGAARTGVMDHEEARESRRIVGNFLYRIGKNNPLNYAFGAGGIAFAAYNGGGAQEIVVGGLAGLSAGYLTHRFHRLLTRNKNIERQLAEFDTSLTLDNVHNTSSIPHEALVQNQPQTENPKKPWYLRHKRKATLTALLASASAADHALTGGYYTRATAGATSIVSVYAPANIIQDNISHIVFLLSGIGAALVTYVAPVRTVRGLRSLFSAETMDSTFPFDDNSYHSQQIKLQIRQNHVTGFEPI